MKQQYHNNKQHYIKQQYHNNKQQLYKTVISQQLYKTIISNNYIIKQCHNKSTFSAVILNGTAVQPLPNLSLLFLSLKKADLGSPKNTELLSPCPRNTVLEHFPVDKWAAPRALIWAAVDVISSIKLNLISCECAEAGRERDLGFWKEELRTLTKNPGDGSVRLFWAGEDKRGRWVTWRVLERSDGGWWYRGVYWAYFCGKDRWNPPIRYTFIFNEIHASVCLVNLINLQRKFYKLNLRSLITLSTHFTRIYLFNINSNYKKKYNIYFYVRLNFFIYNIFNMFH